MNFLLKHQDIFSISPSQFRMVDLWKEAFSIGFKLWMSLLLADAALIVVSHMPAWMPLLGQWFPFLKAFQINPVWINDNAVAAKLAELSRLFAPFLFILFITFPVYLAINLFALRLAYERPVTLSVLHHYIKIPWWTAITTLLFLSGIVVVPLFYAGKLLFLIADNKAYLYQFYVGLILLAVAVAFLTIILSMVLQLIFAARLTVVNAVVMSWKGARMHFWKITIMLLFLYVVQRLRMQTYYLSDLLLMPPSVIAWALLYKNIYGEQGLVE